MTREQLEAEVKRLRARAQSMKRALKVLQGQQRASIQLLAGLDDDLESLLARLEPTAQEAQTDEFHGIEIFAR